MYGSDLMSIMIMFANAFTSIFNIFSNVQFADTGLSLLQVFVAILLLRLIVWFLIRFITGREEDDMEEYESEGAKQQMYGEPSYTSASNIDFSEEILHE